MRKTTWRAWACSALLALAGTTGAAQAAYPEQPIRLVVPFAPGAIIGQLAQLVAEQLSAELGTPVYTDFKTGAGGNIGADIVAKADKDGHTLLLGTISILTINPTLYRDIPFDPVRDFQPVALLATTQNMLVVHPDSDIDSIDGLIEHARKRPGQVTFGSSGTGSTMHLSGELFNTIAEVKMTHVPYRGGNPARLDLLGGRLTLMFSDLGAIPMVEAGKLKALAVTGSQRDERLPELPTMREAGFKDFEVEPWYGIVAPAGTPREAVDTLNAALQKAYAKPEIREAVLRIGLQPPSDLSVDYLQEKIAADLAKWEPIIKTVGMKVE